MTVAVVVLLAIFGDRPVRWVLRPLARLPFLSLERTERAAASFVRGAASLRDPKLAAIAFVLTAVSWILLGLSTWVLMIGFHFGLSPLAGGLVTVAVGLSLVIPSSPAAVGVFETAALIGLEAYGIDKSDALPYALVLHAVNFFPYVIAGLIVLAGARAHAPKERGLMRVSFLVPVYNEESAVGEVLDQVEALDLDKQIVVVDDGSTDGTAAVLDAWRDRPHVVVVRQQNRGKGAAIRTAIATPRARSP